MDGLERLILAAGKAAREEHPRSRAVSRFTSHRWRMAGYANLLASGKPDLVVALNGWLDTSKNVEKSLKSIINAEKMTLDLHLYLRL
jgi:hypothetical protein